MFQYSHPPWGLQHHRAETAPVNASSPWLGTKPQGCNRDGSVSPGLSQKKPRSLAVPGTGADCRQDPQQLRSCFGAAWVGREENIPVAFAAVTAGRDTPQGKTPHSIQPPTSCLLFKSPLLRKQRPFCCSSWLWPPQTTGAAMGSVPTREEPETRPGAKVALINRNL